MQSRTTFFENQAIDTAREVLRWLVTFLETADIPSLATITLDGHLPNGMGALAIDWSALDVTLEKTGVRTFRLNLGNDGLEKEIKNMVPRARGRGLFELQNGSPLRY
jgi:hypothetical protein